MKIDEQRSTESPTEGPEIFRHDVSSLAVLATLVIMAGGGDRLASGQATDPDSNPIMDRINDRLEALGIVDDSRYPRREAVLGLLAPLQLLVDLGAGRSWSPLGQLSDDFSSGLEIVQAHPDVVDRLRDRLGWLELDRDGDVDFAIEAFNHGFDSRAVGSYWAYRGRLHAAGGELETVAVWPTDGIHDQVPWQGPVSWTEHRLQAEDTVEMPDRMRWNPPTPLDLRHNLAWIGERQFGGDVAVMVEDDTLDMDRAVIRDINGSIVCELTASFNGDSLKSIKILQRPTNVLVDLGGSVEITDEHGTVRRAKLPDHGYRRWTGGLVVEIDFKPADPESDAPVRLRAWRDGLPAFEAWFRQLRRNDISIGSDAMLEDSQSFLASIPERQKEVVDAGTEVVGRADSADTLTLALVADIQAWSARHQLPPALALQTLEFWIERLADEGSRNDAPLSGIIKIISQEPWKMATVPLWPEQCLAEVLRQCAQNRPFQADRTLVLNADRLSRIFRDQDASHWLDRLRLSVRNWASAGSVPGAMKFKGRFDFGRSMGRLYLEQIYKWMAGPRAQGEDER